MRYPTKRFAAGCKVPGSGWTVECNYVHRHGAGERDVVVGGTSDGCAVPANAGVLVVGLPWPHLVRLIGGPSARTGACTEVPDHLPRHPAQFWAARVALVPSHSTTRRPFVHVVGTTFPATEEALQQDRDGRRSPLCVAVADCSAGRHARQISPALPNQQSKLNSFPHRLQPSRAFHLLRVSGSFNRDV